MGSLIFSVVFVHLLANIRFILDWEEDSNLRSWSFGFSSFAWRLVMNLGYGFFQGYLFWELVGDSGICVIFAKKNVFHLERISFVDILGCGVGIYCGFFLFEFLFDIFQLSIVSLTVLGILIKSLVQIRLELCIYLERMTSLSLSLSLSRTHTHTHIFTQPSTRALCDTSLTGFNS